MNTPEASLAGPNMQIGQLSKMFPSAAHKILRRYNVNEAHY